MIEGLRGESSIAELRRREGINQNLYYRWSKDYLEASKKRLAGDTQHEANTAEMRSLRQESRELKETFAPQGYGNLISTNGPEQSLNLRQKSSNFL